MLVEPVQVMSLERIVNQVGPLGVASRVKALDAGQLFSLSNARIGQMTGVFFFLDLVIRAFALALQFRQLDRYVVSPRKSFNVAVGLSADDERRPGFIDQNVVNFVDNREVQSALTLLMPRAKTLVAPAG